MCNNTLYWVAVTDDIRALPFWILYSTGFALHSWMLSGKQSDTAWEFAESTVRRDENKKGFVAKTIWMLEQKVNPDKISFTLYSVL